MNRVLLTLFAFAVFGAVPVSAADKESPMAVSGATTVGAQEAKALFDKGTVFVDVRNGKDWGAGRVPGAMHMDLSSAFTDGALLKVVKKDQDMVLYCNGPSCMRSSEASAKAVQWGFKKVYYFRDGFPAWKSAGYPVE